MLAVPTALLDVYSWYERVGGDLAVLDRDASVHELTAQLGAERSEAQASVRDAVLEVWPRRKAVRAAIGHALELETWRSLVQRQGLTREQAIDAMLRFVASV